MGRCCTNPAVWTHFRNNCISRPYGAIRHTWNPQISQPGLRPEPRVPLAKPPRAPRRRRPGLCFPLGDLCVFARDIILAVIGTYIALPELSGNGFQLLRVSSADSSVVIPAKAGIQALSRRGHRGHREKRQRTASTLSPGVPGLTANRQRSMIGLLVSPPWDLFHSVDMREAIRAP